MPNINDFFQDQYPATDETQCLTIYIPAGDEFKWLLAGLLRLPTLPSSYQDPESEQAQGLSDIWRDAYDLTDWGGCDLANSNQGRVSLWHRFSTVTAGGALTTALDTGQPFNHICFQSPAAIGDDFYQYAWLTAGNYEIKVLGVRIANQGQLRVLMQYQADLSTVTALPTTDFHGATLFNFVVSNTFTLTQSGLYKVFGQVPGKNGASSAYTVRLTVIEIVQTS